MAHTNWIQVKCVIWNSKHDEYSVHIITSEMKSCNLDRETLIAVQYILRFHVRC